MCSPGQTFFFSDWEVGGKVGANIYSRPCPNKKVLLCEKTCLGFAAPMSSIETQLTKGNLLHLIV